MSAQLDTRQKNEFDDYWNKIMNLAQKKVDELYPDSADDGVSDWFSKDAKLFNEEARFYKMVKDLFGKDFEAFKKAAVDYAQHLVRIFKEYFEWKRANAAREGSL